MNEEIYLSIGTVVEQNEAGSTVESNGQRFVLDALEAVIYAGLHFARTNEKVLQMIFDRYGDMPREIYFAVIKKLEQQGIVVKFDKSNFDSLYPLNSGSFINETSDHKFVMKSSYGKKVTLEAIYAAVWSQCSGKQSLTHISKRIDEQKLLYRGEEAVSVCVPGLVAYGLATVDVVGGER